MRTIASNYLVQYAKGQLGRPYWYGTFGQVANKTLYEQKKKQYPKYYTASDFSSQYGKKVHDCAGLIKGALWCSTVDGTPTYDSAQDLSANGFITTGCSETGNISTIPEIPGIIVWKDGHVGIYVGNGQVIEARGHAYGVVTTKLTDGRGWLKWGKVKWVSYPTPVTYTAEQAMADVKKIVEKYYGS